MLNPRSRTTRTETPPKQPCSGRLSAFGRVPPVTTWRLSSFSNFHDVHGFLTKGALETKATCHLVRDIKHARSISIRLLSSRTQAVRNMPLSIHFKFRRCPKESNRTHSSKVACTKLTNVQPQVTQGVDNDGLYLSALLSTDMDTA